MCEPRCWEGDKLTRKWTEILVLVTIEAQRRTAILHESGFWICEGFACYKKK